MEQYFAKLCVYYTDCNYRHLRVHWLSYSHNIIEASDGLVKFIHGLQIIPGVEKIVVDSITRRFEMHTGTTKDLYVPISDKHAIRRLLNLEGAHDV